MIENASIDPNIFGVLPAICVSEVGITQMRSAIVCAHIKETAVIILLQRGSQWWLCVSVRTDTRVLSTQK